MNEKSKKAVDFAGFADAGVADLERDEKGGGSNQPRTPKARPQAQSKPVPRQQSRPPAPPPPVSSSSGGKNIWLWILGGFIVFLIWAANQDGGSGRTTGSSSTTQTPPSSSRPQTPPAPPTLSTPPVGTNHVHSSAEIRYCLAADIRVEALRPRMNSNSQIDAFNGIISDYNNRCGNYRYRSGALERARRAIEPYRSVIVANAWDGVSLVRRSAPQQKPPVRRSQLTMDIQKALSELGYQPGTADGIYGQKTKSAIQSFQRDIGVPQDGVANSQLLELVRKESSRRSSQRPSNQPRATDPGPTDAELREIIRVAADPGVGFSDRFDAEAWLTDMSIRLRQQVPDPVERIELLKLIHMEAARVELPPELILAVIEVESNFDRYAVSVDGELGLMQIQPYWLDEIGRPDDNLLNTSTNLRYGCTILRFYYDKENGDLRRALGRYDNSLGQRSYPNKVIDKLSKKWFQA